MWRETGVLAVFAVLGAEEVCSAAQGTSCQQSLLQTQSVPASNTGWMDSVTFDQFDPDLGDLQEVRVTLNGTIQGQAAFESTANKPSTVTVTFSASLSVLRPGPMSALVTTNPELSFIEMVAAYDGMLDFGGSSGKTYAGLSTVATSQYVATAPSADIALFTGMGGAGPPGSVTLPVIATGISTGTGAGNLVLQFMQEGSALVQLEYLYDTCTCDEDSIPPMLTNWSDSVTLEKFDPDLGTLTAVHLELLGLLQGQAGVESQDSQPSVVSLDFSGQIEVSRPAGGGVLAAVPLSQGFVLPLSAFDGVLDFDGTSGITQAGISVNDSNVYSASGISSDLALFTGSPGAGSPGTIALPVTALGTSSATGPGGLTVFFTQDASAEVRVCYEYDPAFGLGRSLCNGDGGDQMGCTNCPCMNNSTPGTIGGCLNSAGTSSRLRASGSASLSLPVGATTDLRFQAEAMPPGAFGVLSSGNTVAPGNPMSPCFGMSSGVPSVEFDGLRCAIQQTQRHGGRAANLLGDINDSTGPSRVWGGESQPPAGLGVQAGFVAGQTRYFQIVHRDDLAAVCMRGLNTTQAIEVSFLP